MPDWCRARAKGRLEAYQDALAQLRSMPRVPTRLKTYLETQVELHEQQLQNDPRLKRNRRREDQRSRT